MRHATKQGLWLAACTVWAWVSEHRAVLAYLCLIATCAGVLAGSVALALWQTHQGLHP